MKRIFFLAAVLNSISWLGCQPAEITSARLYIKTQDWDAAMEQLVKATQEYPKNPEAHFLLGTAYSRAGDFLRMNRAFERSLGLSGKYKVSITAIRESLWTEQYNAGMVAYREKRFEESEMRFLKALAIDSTQHQAFEKLALVYVDSDRLSQAVDIHNLLLRERPDDLDLLTSTANLFYNLRQYDRVVEILSRILSIQPDHRDALANLAMTYDRMEQPGQAQEAYLRAIRANPHDADLVFLYGVHLYRQKEYEEAVEVFHKALEMKPDDFEIIANIAGAYLSLAKMQRIELKRASKKEITREAVHDLKNSALDNYKKAIPFLERALEIKPSQPVLWRNLGIAYIATGRKEQGTEAFLKSEELQLQQLN
jgi:tetratricopeptide (TPR) repeat protein